MFKETFTRALKGMRRIKTCCNTLIAKPEKSAFPEITNCYKALILMAPMSNTVATTISHALWQESRASIKIIKRVSPYVLPRIKEKSTGSF